MINEIIFTGAIRALVLVCALAPSIVAITWISVSDLRSRLVPRRIIAWGLLAQGILNLALMSSAGAPWLVLWAIAAGVCTWLMQYTLALLRPLALGWGDVNAAALIGHMLGSYIAYQSCLPALQWQLLKLQPTAIALSSSWSVMLMQVCFALALWHVVSGMMGFSALKACQMYQRMQRIRQHREHVSRASCKSKHPSSAHLDHVAVHDATVPDVPHCKASHASTLSIPFAPIMSLACIAVMLALH